MQPFNLESLGTWEAGWEKYNVRIHISLQRVIEHNSPRGGISRDEHFTSGDSLEGKLQIIFLSYITLGQITDYINYLNVNVIYRLH